MCRVNCRAAPRNRAEAGVLLKPDPAGVYEQCQGFAQQEQLQIALNADDIDFENLFEDDDEPGLETGELDLLALFSDDTVSAETSLQQQPAASVAYAGPSVVEATPAAQTVQQLQLQAMLQQQMAQAAQQQQQQYVAAAAATTTATGIPQDLTQLQQIQAAQMQAMLAAQASLRQGQQVVSKRGKTQAEMEEQQERIKKRRRESAQRSRARKNTYMKSLEMENKALKMENERLRVELMKLSHKSGSTSSSKPNTPSQQVVLSDHDHSELSLSEEEMCNDKSGMSLPVMPAGAAAFFHLGL